MIVCSNIQSGYGAIIEMSPVGLNVHPVYRFIGASPDVFITITTINGTRLYYIAELKCRQNLNKPTPIEEQWDYYSQVQTQIACVQENLQGLKITGCFFLQVNFALDNCILQFVPPNPAW